MKKSNTQFTRRAHIDGKSSGTSESVRQAQRITRPRRAHIAANNKEMQALLLSLHATTVALQAA